MGEWLFQFWDGMTLTRVLMGGAAGILMFGGGMALVSLVLVRVPADYFSESHAREFWTDKHHTVRWAGAAAKNLLGAFLVVLGIAMTVLPGPGLLTILIGIMLLDVPGKRELERRIIGRPQVFDGINNLRARFNKPPLLLD